MLLLTLMNNIRPTYLDNQLFLGTKASVYQHLIAMEGGALLFDDSPGHGHHEDDD